MASQMVKVFYTDMNAIRRDETTDNIHSIFVDQWDWGKKSSQKEDRTLDTFKSPLSVMYTKTLRKDRKCTWQSSMIT